MDENQQTTSTDNTEAPETTQSINTDSPVLPTDYQAPEVPPEAPESPTNVVDMPLGKDDNGANIEPVTTTPEPVIQPQTVEKPASYTQTPVKSSDFSSGEQTAQMGGDEPIRTQSFIRGLLDKAKLAIQSRKRNKLDKIMNLFAKQTNITNDEVEKYLHVSDATATRYLSILEKEGKIKQNGKTGKGVLYAKL